MVIIGMFLIAGCSIDSTQHTHSDDELHDHSVEIEGREMKLLTVQQVADLWEIDSKELFDVGNRDLQKISRFYIILFQSIMIFLDES